MSYPKKLIEVALPLAEINDASAYDKMPGIGAHPKSIHHWWARLPLPVARAILFASVINDPSESINELLADEKRVKKAQTEYVKRKKVWDSKKLDRDKCIEAGLDVQELEIEPSVNSILIENRREELFQVIRGLMEKKPHQNLNYFKIARQLIDQSCEGRLPEVLDPFTGGGSIPLEAQRLGFKAHGRDLNPVPALLTKATIEYPAKYFGAPAVNPSDCCRQDWIGAQGIAEDIKYYGDWILCEAKKKIGTYYPDAKITSEMVADRSDLIPYEGQELPVISWIWARTIPSPNPAFQSCEVPLVTTFWLSRKKGKEAYVEPIISGLNYEFKVRVGCPENKEIVKAGTKKHRGDFQCILSGSPIPSRLIKEFGKSNKFSYRLMAVVADGGRKRIYLDPDKYQQECAKCPDLSGQLQRVELPSNSQYSAPPLYGLNFYSDLFSERQLLALITFSDLITQARLKALSDGATEDYADALATYLAFAVDRLADFNCSLSTWKSTGEQQMHLFGRQAIPMAWDFCEANVLGDGAICWKNSIKYLQQGIGVTPILDSLVGEVKQQDAAMTRWDKHSLIISTDPPYYDNVPYADLSDFFYIWLRRSLKTIHPDLMSTMQTPKREELVAAPHRHGGDKNLAKNHFEGGFRNAFGGMLDAIDPRFPLTVYYAMKQSEGDEGTNSGWATMLQGLIDSGFQITATWPVRAAQDWRMRSMGSNALANYVVLACRKKNSNALIATRKEFVHSLTIELPPSLSELQQSNIGPVDFFQAALGPGMGIFSRFAKVVEADGSRMSVGEALRCINEEVSLFLDNQTGELDPWTRFAVAWFSQNAFCSADFGIADNLARSNNISVQGVVDAGILESSTGNVRLLRWNELDQGWTPEEDDRLTIWEITHYLIKELEDDSGGGELGASSIVKKIGGLAEDVRKLTYQLFNICEQNKWADLALNYNQLISAWPNLLQIADQTNAPTVSQTELKI